VLTAYRSDHVEHGAGFGHIVGAEGPSTKPGTHSGCRQGSDKSFGWNWNAKSFAHEILARQRHQDRPPGVDQLSESVGGLERVAGVFAKVVPWINEDRVARNAGDCGALGFGNATLHNVGDHVVVGHAVRTGTRQGAPCMGAHQSHAELGSHFGQLGIDAAPGIVHQISAFLTRRPSYLSPPRIDADDDLGMSCAHQTDERRDPAQFLSRIDLGPRTGLDAANINDVSSAVDRSLNALEGVGISHMSATVVERVGCAVDDGHDHAVIRCERATTQDEIALRYLWHSHIFTADRVGAARPPDTTQ